MKVDQDEEIALVKMNDVPATIKLGITFDISQMTSLPSCNALSEVKTVMCCMCSTI